MTFLRSYGTAQEEEFRELAERSVSRLPPTLSKPVASLMREVEKGNFSAGMNYALDFLEISVQFVSCCLFVLLQDAEKELPEDAKAMKAIVDKIDCKRSLSFGDWVNDIFNPAVRAALKELPDNPLVRSLDDALFVRGANRLLGTKTEPSVVRIRNEYKGHSTTLSNEIYRGVVFTLEPQILAVLKAVEPLQEFSFNFSDGGGSLFRSPDGTESDLYPLVFRNEKGYVYVFQSLKDEDISYISSDEEAVTLIDDSRNAAFDRLLQRSSRSFDIAKEMNWTEMRALLNAESARFLGRVYREKKYNRELFVERKALSRLLGEFSASPLTLFPLLGEAGQGKTNQLCWWTEEISKGDDAVLIFSSSDFAGESLPDALRRIFRSSPRKDAAKIVRELHKRAGEEGRTVYIFFDAVNECLRYKDAPADELNGPAALYEAFRELFIRIPALQTAFHLPQLLLEDAVPAPDEARRHTDVRTRPRAGLRSARLQRRGAQDGLGHIPEPLPDERRLRRTLEGLARQAEGSADTQDRLHQPRGDRAAAGASGLQLHRPVRRHDRQDSALLRRPPAARDHAHDSRLHTR